jgi:hypothetical protein
MKLRDKRNKEESQRKQILAKSMFRVFSKASTTLAFFQQSGKTQTASWKG